MLALTAPDAYGDFVALPVTSRPQVEHGVPLAPADLVHGSLPAASWIRTDRIAHITSVAYPFLEAGGELRESRLWVATE